jgi:hypothetical protein
VENSTPITAPGGLWIFGEEGVAWMACDETGAVDARWLFPETDVHGVRAAQPVVYESMPPIVVDAAPPPGLLDIEIAPPE